MAHNHTCSHNPFLVTHPSLTYSFTHSLSHSLSPSFSLSLPHSLIPSLTHSFTHSLTDSLSTPSLTLFCFLAPSLITSLLVSLSPYFTHSWHHSIALSFPQSDGVWVSKSDLTWTVNTSTQHKGPLTATASWAASKSHQRSLFHYQSTSSYYI